jgi:hypothetical protein
MLLTKGKASRGSRRQRSCRSARWRLTLDKTRLAGGCEWILPFVGEPSIREQGKTLSISIPKRTAGDWIAVHAIKSARAYFYKAPGESQAQKAFLVAGDTAYVYEERLDWMYVKFQGRKSLTSGWIKKSDTVQF